MDISVESLRLAPKTQVLCGRVRPGNRASRLLHTSLLYCNRVSVPRRERLWIQNGPTTRKTRWKSIGTEWKRCYSALTFHFPLRLSIASVHYHGIPASCFSHPPHLTRTILWQVHSLKIHKISLLGRQIRRTKVGSAFHWSITKRGSIT